MSANSIYNKEFCVYITIYSGNKLPIFYIGSGTISKIEDGYRGSVSSRQYKEIWVSELKEHPELFRIKIIKYFDERQHATNYEEIIQRKLNVVRNPLYCNMSYANKGFIFGHMKGREVSDESRKKRSGSLKGHFVSDETRDKISL